MDEIKVGEYVRTECGIAKIKEISIKNESYELDKDIMYIHQENYLHTCTKSQILNHSFSIIDLVEENDIVGYTINCLSKFKVGRVKKYKDARSNKQYLGVEGFDITKIYIEEILTKEQYEKNCYRLEDN